EARVGRDVELLERAASNERRAAGLPERTRVLRAGLDLADGCFERAEPCRIRATTRSGVSGGQLMTPRLIASPTVPVSNETGRSSRRCSTYTMRRWSSRRRTAASG